MDDIISLVSRVQRGTRLTFDLLLRLLGNLTTASSVVPLGLLSMFPSQMWVNDLGLDPKRYQGRMVMVSGQCFQSLTPWRSRAYLSSCVPLNSLPFRQEVLVTDASLLGWGLCGTAGQ